MLSKVTVWEHPEQNVGVRSMGLSFNALKSRFFGVNSGIKSIAVPRELHLVYLISLLLIARRNSSARANDQKS
jgi:hypothetical protein